MTKKKTSKRCINCHSWEQSTYMWWILFTNAQKCGNRFHAKGFWRLSIHWRTWIRIIGNISWSIVASQRTHSRTVLLLHNCLECSIALLHQLTNGGLVTHKAPEIRIKIGIGNGLLPDGTIPLPEPILTNRHWGFVVFSWGQFHRKWSRYISLIQVWQWLM